MAWCVKCTLKNKIVSIYPNKAVVFLNSARQPYHQYKSKGNEVIRYSLYISTSRDEYLNSYSPIMYTISYSKVQHWYINYSVSRTESDSLTKGLPEIFGWFLQHRLQTTSQKPEKAWMDGDGGRWSFYKRLKLFTCPNRHPLSLTFNTGASFTCTKSLYHWYFGGKMSPWPELVICFSTN